MAKERDFSGYKVPWGEKVHGGKSTIVPTQDANWAGKDKPNEERGSKKSVGQEKK